MIQRKLKICKTCKTHQYLFSHGNCRSCWVKHKANEANLKPFKPRAPLKQYQTKAIKQVSTKQQKLNAAYMVLRNQHLKNHPTCVARLEHCTYIATQVHHPRGRGVYLLDDKLFKGLCDPCHHWCEEHPEAAKALGLSGNRLDKY